MTADDGITVSVNVGKAREGGEPESLPPTRYSMALRRQAANRARKRLDQQLLPEVRAGSCDHCAGWGVHNGDRCKRCNGSGDA